MSELPKFVAQRLQASAATGEHPSADLLAGFAEQALAGEERERLLAHLAACDQCREVVWCATPETEAAQPVVVGVSAKRWFGSSAWRWAGVAAGIVVLAGVAVLFRGGPGPAGEKLASAPTMPVIAQKHDQALKESLEDKKAATAPSREARLQVRNAPPNAATGRRPQAKDMQPSAAAVSREPASANEIAAEKTLAKSADEVAPRVAAAAPGASAPAPAPPPAALAAKTAPASTAQAGVMIASKMPARDIGKKKLAPPTRWMLSGDGALLRSTDSGKNWQMVPFEGKVVFHAVAAVGPKVWVAGQGGAVYYSSDDGSQWQRLSLSNAGTPVTDDFTALTFSDAQHGSLTTASGQTWTTSDGGHSWQKQ